MPAKGSGKNKGRRKGGGFQKTAEKLQSDRLFGDEYQEQDSDEEDDDDDDN